MSGTQSLARTYRLVPTTDHSSHPEAHTFVTVDKVAEKFTCSRHGDAFLVSKLVQATLHAKVCLPVLTIACITVNILTYNKMKGLDTLAVPAKVPSKYGLISITFFTVPEANKGGKSQ